MRIADFPDHRLPFSSAETVPGEGSPFSIEKESDPFPV